MTNCMSITLYILHTLSFIFQIFGGAIVISETLKTLRNVRSLRDNLKECEAIKQKHRENLKPSFLDLWIW